MKIRKLYHKPDHISSFGMRRQAEELSEHLHGRRTFRKKRFTQKHAFGGAIFAGSLSLAYAAASMFAGPILHTDIATTTPQILTTPVIETVLPPAIHLKIPDAVKAAYMSACVAATPSIRDRVIHIADTTEINSIVLDIKDFSGQISYEPSNEALRQDPDERSCRIRDMRGLIELLHNDNIYVIGRIAVFQDPLFVKLHPDQAVKRASDGGVWTDRKGISWVDTGSSEMWDYVVSIARDAYSQGVDEINFDYVRFPSDGDISNMSFPVSGTTTKPEVVKSFFSYLSGEMKASGITTSADLFGMTTTATDDMNIGQTLEIALPYFDYIAPMVYPSHYPDGFNGWANPNAHPYELIKFVMSAGAEKALKASTTPLKLRPWLQDFSLGSPSYGKKEVEDQIQATYDVGLTSWMLWDPSNKYAGGALLPE